MFYFFIFGRNFANKGQPEVSIGLIKYLTAVLIGFFPLSMLAADLLTNDPSEACIKRIESRKHST